MPAMTVSRSDYGGDMDQEIVSMQTSLKLSEISSKYQEKLSRASDADYIRQRSRSRYSIIKR